MHGNSGPAGMVPTDLVVTRWPWPLECPLEHRAVGRPVR